MSFPLDSTRLSQLANQIENWHKEQAPAKPLSENELKHLAELIQSCNEHMEGLMDVVTGKKITIDMQLQMNLARFFHAANLFSMYDKSTQVRINQYQQGLFSAFSKRYKRLEKNLKKHRIGIKVAETNTEQGKIKPGG